MKMKLIIKAMAEIAVEVKKSDFRIEAIERIGGGELPDLRIGITGPILDLLGVPPDNTEEVRKKHGDKAFEMKELFCRDGLYDEFYDLPANKNKITKWLTTVAGEYKPRLKTKEA